MVRPPYPAVVRLVAIAAEHWAAIDGEAALHGVDYLTLPFDRFCNAVYWWAVQRVKDVDRFVADLDRPIGGAPAGAAVSDRELEQDAEAFMAFAQAMGLKPPTNGDQAQQPGLPSPPSPEPP